MIFVRQIPQSVKDGTEESIKLAMEVYQFFLDNPLMDDVTATNYLETLYQKHKCSAKDLIWGFIHFLERSMYLGSQVIQENLTGLIGAPNLEEAVGIMRQWRDMEERMWEVIPDIPEGAPEVPKTLVEEEEPVDDKNE